MEKISVIVPVYNVEKYVEKCLDSIIRQTYQNLEIICINDGSTDRSLELCKKIQKQDERIRVVTQKNKGLAAVRNRGIQEATSEYIAFIDSDDYIDEDYIEKLYECLIENDADISVANVEYENVDEKRYLLTEEFQDKKVLNREQAMREYLNPSGGLGNYIVNKLYKKSMFSGIYFPENKLFEDAYTMFRILDHVNRVSVQMHTNYHYYIRTDSITGRYENEVENYDLLSANLEKAHFICERFPELASLVFHQYFTAFLWVTNRSVVQKTNNNDVLNKYLQDLRELKKKYNIKLYGLKGKLSFAFMCVHLDLYKKIYRILKRKQK